MDLRLEWSQSGISSGDKAAAGHVGGSVHVWVTNSSMHVCVVNNGALLLPLGEDSIAASI